MQREFEVQLSIADLFRVHAFHGSTYELVEEGDTFSLTLCPGMPPIYVKKYPLSEKHRDIPSLLDELEREAKRFVDEGMTPVVRRTPSYSIESGSVSSLEYQQVVADVGKGMWWIARLFGKLDNDSYYLLHWVGKEAKAEVVVSAFATFELIAA